ncbi:AAA family ATPase [Roseicella aerolata]|uniref:AAA family ATPase n=1 Tax=Roseicella aerolata TaxID=2883479 RepID=A0A9X1L9H5_9PROT|nr:AAA family ATPase [Roseicella aerolata]MCB4821170.1 AAA family ATPase [Roseicella aerolata]
MDEGKSSAPTKPVALEVREHGIPKCLKNHNAWMCWRYVLRGTKWNKVPFQPNGKHASSTNPATWNSFDAVMAAYKHGGFDGIGIALDGKPDANGLVLAGIDFDKVLDGDRLADNAKEWIKRVGTYWEKSPSNTGIRLFCYARPLPSGIAAGGAELYTAGRYLTVTGHGVGEVKEAADAFDALAAALKPQIKAPHGASGGITPGVIQGALPRFPVAVAQIAGQMAAVFKGMTPSPDEFGGGIKDRPDLEKIRSAAEAVNQPVNGVRPLADEKRWCDVAMTLAAAAAEYPEHEEDLYTILDDVSKQPGTDKYEATENRKRFDRFKQDTLTRRAKGQTVQTIATLFHMAQQVGWQPPQLLQQPALPALAALDVATMPAVLPKRQWLYGSDLVRGYVTVLAAPGGAGKTALTISTGLALATGQALLGDWVHSPQRVLLVNGEDGTNELLLRVQAAAIHHRVAMSALHGRLFPAGADKLRLRLVVIDPQTRAPTVNVQALDHLVALARDVDVVVLDPLVRFSEASENDAAAADMLMAALSRVASEAGVAVLAVHHTRKGARADADGADAVRGSSAIVAAARVALGITTLRPEEALKLGVPPDLARLHFSLDNLKANLAPPSERRWFHLVSVQLTNADPANGYHEGDKVQAVERFTPQPTASLLTDAVRQAVLRAVAAGCPGPAGGPVMPLSPSSNAGQRSAMPVIAAAIAPFFGQFSEEQHKQLAKEVLADVMGRGWITEETVQVPKKGRGTNGRQGLVVHWDRTLWPDAAKPDGGATT